MPNNATQQTSTATIMRSVKPAISNAIAHVSLLGGSVTVNCLQLLLGFACAS